MDPPYYTTYLLTLAFVSHYDYNRILGILSFTTSHTNTQLRLYNYLLPYPSGCTKLYSFSAWILPQYFLYVNVVVGLPLALLVPKPQ